MKIKRILITAAVLSVVVASLAGITIDVNSYYPLATGPLYPFPRFVSTYPAGSNADLYTLADSAHQPDGLSHAEMEQYITDAYKIMTNRWAYSGTAPYQLAGGGNPAPVIQMINVQADNANCSEGQGYALLAAALMADKPAFDGIWFWLVENGRLMNAKKYSDNSWVSRGTNGANHGQYYISVYDPPGDSATDGDMDIAMALLIAWRQWGDFTGYYALGGEGPETEPGNPSYKAIKYKDMAIAAIRYLVALDLGDDHVNQPRDWYTGVVGFDGYHKGGNTQNENTAAVLSPNGAIDPWDGPYGSTTEGPASVGENFYDYTGPFYWREFSDALIKNNAPKDINDTTLLQYNGVPFGRWNVNQLERVAASDFWLQGQLYSGYAVPLAGYYNASATNAVFATMNAGEDFRSIWRHALDYVFYGNPPANKTWNPGTRTIDGSTGNNYEYLAAMKLADFLEDTAGTRCHPWGSFGLTFKGAAETRQGYDLNGGILADVDNHVNFVMGTASPAVLISQRFPFMESWFRELFVTWDAMTVNDGYINSVPLYMHDWFRLLGLLVLSGNYVSPETAVQQAEMKIYKAINKTYAFTGDTLTYWLNYRNYGSVAASNVQITDNLDPDFKFILATDGGGGTHTVLGQNVTWNIPVVAGLNSQNKNFTMGGVTLVVQVRNNALGKYCNTSSITCANGSGWISNDQPNEITKICKTNCVDIVSAALTITKTATNFLANPGDTLTYTIHYCDSSDAGWINGGRYGVNFSIAEHPMTNNGIKRLTVRGEHEATEPWIDWSNYRISYFINSTYHGIYNASTNPAGWQIEEFQVEGTPGLVLSTEDLVADCNPSGGPNNCWNQRLIIGFQTSVALPGHILHKYFNNTTYMHYPDGFATGAKQPLAIVVGIAPNGQPPQNWADDWSQLPITSPYKQAPYGAGEFLFPISPDWTKGDGTSVPVDRMNKEACNGINPPMSNILVEEFDGYTWRRVYGNGPQPGRQVKNVVVIDSLPTGVTFRGWIDSDSATKTVSGRNININVGDMNINQCGDAKYWVTVDGSCPSGIVNPDMKNIAFISGTNESPIADSWVVSVTCSYIPPPPPPPSSITKTASTLSPALNSDFTYFVDYTNLNGTVVNSANVSQNVFTAGNWTKRYGNGTWNFSGTQAVAATLDANISTYNYSHGINGVVQLRASIQDGQDFSVVVRQTSGTTVADGIYVRIRYAWDGNRIQIYNGATAVGPEKIATAMKDLDIKIVLNGDTISVFEKNITDVNFPPSADLSVSGLPVRAGYAGIVNGTVPTFPAWQGGNHTVKSWYSSLDTAFNVLVHDPMPAGLNYIGGTNSVTVTSAGDVNWPLIPMLLYGQSISYKWYAKATGPCGPVVNTAFAVPQGVTYTIADQVSINIGCGGSPTITPSSTATYTYTRTNTSTNTQTSTPTLSPSFTPSLTNTCSSTLTQTPSGTATVSVSATPTYTYTNTPSSTNTKTGTPTQTVTDTLSSNTPTFTLTSTNSYTASPTFTATNSMTASPTYSFTATATSTGTDTGTQTLTQTGTPTVTVTGTDIIYTRTITPTWTDTFTYTATPTQSGTGTNTSTSTATKTYTATLTQSGTGTDTPTYTATKTYTATPTQSSTGTDTPTYTATGTFTKTLTVTNTRTQTATPTMTGTWTNTATATGTPMPSPVTLDITLTTSGDVPAVGALITYTIRIVNNTPYSVDHVAIWDTLPQDMVFENEIIGPSPVRTGNYMSWDLSNELLGSAAIPGRLEPNGEITIEFTARIKTIDPSRLPMSNTAMTDYNDPYYTTTIGKHPPLESETSFYPIGKPVVFPNPFNLDTNKVVIFDNVVPGSMIQIYTLSGERVKAIYSAGIRATWDCKNTNNKVISPGIYYFVITNQSSGQVRKGKIFVVRGN